MRTRITTSKGSERRIDITNWTTAELIEYDRLRKGIKGLVREGHFRLYAIVQ